jgi:hypothetical protein
MVNSGYLSPCADDKQTSRIRILFFNNAIIILYTFSPSKAKEQLDNLTKSYAKKTGSCYSIIHDKLWHNKGKKSYCSNTFISCIILVSSSVRWDIAIPRLSPTVKALSMYKLCTIGMSCLTVYRKLLMVSMLKYCYLVGHIFRILENQ